MLSKKKKEAPLKINNKYFFVIQDLAKNDLFKSAFIFIGYIPIQYFLVTDFRLATIFHISNIMFYMKPQIRII